jgi:hypothetical protein
MRPLLSFLIAALFTGVVYFFETRSIRTDFVELSLKSARQTAQQVESLFKYAKEKGEKDPLAWATQFLKGPTGWQISDIQVNSLDLLVVGSEKYRINFKENYFEYLRHLNSGDGIGIKLQTHINYVGFLGSRNPEMSFLVAGLVFIFIFLVSFSLGADGKNSLPDKESDSPVNEKPTEASSSLMRLARCIKKLVQEIQRILDVTSKSIEIINSVYFRSMWLKESLDELKNNLGQEQKKSPQLNSTLTRLTDLVDAQFESGEAVRQKYEEILYLNSTVYEALTEVKKALVEEVEASKTTETWPPKNDKQL